MKPRPETGLCGLTHGDKLFRRRRVNGDGVVKVFLVAPIFSATAKPCSISSIPKPIP